MTVESQGRWLFPQVERPPWFATAGDVALVLVALFVSVGNSSEQAATGVLNGQAASVAVAALAAVALLWRRRFPLPVALAGLAGWCLDGVVLPFLVASYTLAAARGGDRVVWALALVGLVRGCGPSIADGALRFDVSEMTVAGLTATFVGLYVNARRRLIEQLRERTRTLERERDLVASRARADERTAIAREMHDVIAHRVSLMVLHAGALELALGRDEAQAERAAHTIRTTGRLALSELGEIVGVLRTDGGAAPAAPLAPQPTLDDLDTLLGDWRATGATLELAVEGERRPLPAGVERTAYRLVQEGLTNARRHAPGTTVAVRLAYGRGTLGVSVRNGGPPAGDGRDAPPRAETGGGHGLLGLRERVALAGGELHAEPTLDGGFHLSARLPA